MAEDSNTSSSGWRDDPLSIALFFAFALLVAMFSIDEWRKSAILERAQGVADLGSPLGDACSLSATGPGGRILLVRCQELAASAAREQAVSVWAEALPGGYDVAAFRDSAGTLVCAGPGNTWGEQTSCSEPARALTREELQEALRRRNRAEE